MKRSILFIVLFVASLFSCRKEKASWNSDYQLILVNDTLRLNQISKDSLFEEDLNDGSLRLKFEKEVLNFNVFELIDIPDTTIVQKYGIAVNSYMVQPGFSFVNNAKDHAFDLGDTKLVFAGIETGKVKLEVENPYETKVKFEVSLPKVTKDGVILKKVFDVNKGTLGNPTKASVEVDISEYEIDLTGTSGTSFNKLQTVMKITSDPTGNTIEIDKYDTTVFTVKFNDLKLNRARGYFGQLSQEKSFYTKIDVIDKLEGLLDVQNINLGLKILNSCKLEGAVKVNAIINKNERTQSEVSLQHDIIGNSLLIQSATGNWQNHQAFERSFSVTSQNSNLGNFIGNLGGKITGSANLKLNPNGNTSAGWNELFTDSRLKVILSADMPLKLNVSNLVFKDTFQLNLKNQVNKTHVKSGKFILKASNAYPLDLTAGLTLLGENNQVIGVVNASQRIPASVEGTNSYQGLMYSTAELVFDINEELAGKLSEVKNVVIQLRTNSFSDISTNGVTTLPYKGFIATKLYGDFGVKFKL